MSEFLNNSGEKRNTAYLLSLLSAVINEKEPGEPDFQPDWEFIYEFAKKHSVDNTVFYAVEKLKNKPEPQLFKKWMDERNKCIHRNMIQRQEYAEICSAFEENGIEYMPVKGFYISALYPTEDSRYMSDIDILIKDRRDDAVKILLDKGYSLKKESIDYDKPLIKPPFMVVELHNSLFPLYSPYRAYFEDVFSKSSNNGHCFKMNSEDFYAYEVAHLYKHHYGGGTGIRSIIDFYLINKNILPKLEKKRIESNLKELEMYNYSEEIAAMAEKWFKYEDYSSFSELEMYILGSGTYGTSENKIVNTIEASSKSEFIRTRFFPPKTTMYELFPKLQKYPYLLPFYYLFRLFRGVFTKRKKLKEEYKFLKSTNNNKE